MAMQKSDAMRQQEKYVEEIVAHRPKRTKNEVMQIDTPKLVDRLDSSSNYCCSFNDVKPILRPNLGLPFGSRRQNELGFARLPLYVIINN
jgi:hypothetical protein